RCEGDVGAGILEHVVRCGQLLQPEAGLAAGVAQLVVGGQNHQDFHGGSFAWSLKGARVAMAPWRSEQSSEYLTAVRGQSLPFAATRFRDRMGWVPIAAGCGGQASRISIRSLPLRGLARSRARGPTWPVRLRCVPPQGTRAKPAISQ